MTDRLTDSWVGIFSHDASHDVQVTASFPESNPFGRESIYILDIPGLTDGLFPLVVVNGERNGLFIHLNNQGTKNYTLLSAASSFHDPERHWALVSSISKTYSVSVTCSETDSWVVD